MVANGVHTGSGADEALAGRPLQLVRFDGDKLALGEEALAVLKRVQAPIAVVAVAGRARTGKRGLLQPGRREAAGSARATPSPLQPGCGCSSLLLMS